MYLTKFSLDIRGNHEYNLSQYKEEIGIISGYGDLVFENPVTWYNYNEQMVKYSKKYPDVIFILTGAGAKSADLWKRYYKNGNVQVAEAIITYPEYIDYESEKPVKPIDEPIEVVNKKPIPKKKIEEYHTIVEPVSLIEPEQKVEPEQEIEHVTTYEDKKNWWDKLSETTQDSINHHLFYHKVFDLEKAYDTYHEIIQ
jgi:hypothetical protein